MTQTELPFDPTLAEKADRWMHTPGGRHIMRDLYAIAADYVSAWQRSRIPISIALIYEIERQKIKCVKARALRSGLVIRDEYGYTLNNDWKAYIARHMMNRRPEWEGLFETRRLRAVA